MSERTRLELKELIQRAKRAAETSEDIQRNLQRAINQSKTLESERLRRLRKKPESDRDEK